MSFRDLILLVGGLFLIGKSVHEMHAKLEAEDAHRKEPRGKAGFGAVMIQIAILDIVFSLDSVITAVGMVDYITIMIIAVMIAVGLYPADRFVHSTRFRVPRP